jgi:flagellar protein FliS
MYSANAARNRFSAGNLEGVSGPRIVVMCFDRLERDLTTAVAAIERSDHYEANTALAHAQDLIGELAGMLDTAAWEHAGSLLSIYDYLLRLLAVANMKKDEAKVREALRHVGELAEAFRAAERDAIAATAPTIVEPAGDPTTRPRISVRA